MAKEEAFIQELTGSLASELLKALGLPSRPLFWHLVSPWVRRPLTKFSYLAAEFDRLATAGGFQAAARWFIKQFVDHTDCWGIDMVPRRGPLLIVANHPGVYDSLLIAGHLPRDDLKILSSPIPFLEKLPVTRNHLIFSAPETTARVRAARKAVDHLKAGGALLLFARGRIDPDPAWMNGAEEEIGRWSSSPALFLKRVPETRLVISIVSGILSPHFLGHPLTALRRERTDKQRIAEFFQVIRQVLVPDAVQIAPHLSLSPPFTLQDLGGFSDLKSTARKIIRIGRRELAHHQKLYLPGT